MLLLLLAFLTITGTTINPDSPSLFSMSQDERTKQKDDRNTLRIRVLHLEIMKFFAPGLAAAVAVALPVARCCNTDLIIIYHVQWDNFYCRLLALPLMHVQKFKNYIVRLSKLFN